VSTLLVKSYILGLHCLLYRGLHKTVLSLSNQYNQVILFSGHQVEFHSMKHNKKWPEKIK